MTTESIEKIPVSVELTAPPKLALVLSPGFLRGWFHFGVMDKLNEMGIHPDMIVGSSIGAYVGIVAATRTPIDYVREAQKEYRTNTMFEINLKNKGIFSNDHGMALLKKHYCQYSNLEDLPVPFHVMATDFQTKKPFVFSSGSIWPRIQASIANPLLYPPVEIDGKYYIDGGITSPAPVDVARKLGADIVIFSDAYSENFNRQISTIEDLPAIKRLLLRSFHNTELNKFGKIYAILKSLMIAKSMTQDLLDCTLAMQNQIIDLMMQIHPPDVHIKMTNALPDTSIPLTNESFRNGDYFIDKGREAGEYYRPQLELIRADLISNFHKLPTKRS